MSKTDTVPPSRSLHFTSFTVSLFLCDFGSSPTFSRMLHFPFLFFEFLFCQFSLLCCECFLCIIYCPFFACFCWLIFCWIKIIPPCSVPSHLKVIKDARVPKSETQVSHTLTITHPVTPFLRLNSPSFSLGFLDPFSLFLQCVSSFLASLLSLSSIDL